MKNVGSKLIFSVIACLFAGCTGGASKPVQFANLGDDYVFTIDYVDVDRKFILKLSSMLSVDLCIGVDDWPNVFGQISGGSERAVVTGGGKTFSANDTNFGYCVGSGCIIRIKPYETLSAFVGYKEFAGPDEIEALFDKKLIYNVQPFICADSVER